MKLILPLLVGGLCLAGFCSADIGANQKQRFLQVMQYCQKRLSIPDELNILARTIHNRNFNYSELDKKYITCGYQQLGWIGADGNLNARVMESFLTGNYNSPKVKALVKHCINNNLQPHTEKVASFHRCFFSKKPFNL